MNDDDYELSDRLTAAGALNDIQRDEIRRFAAAYVRESTRPDCDPAMRFRASLATGYDAWFPSHAEAVAAVRLAAGLGPRWAGGD